MKRVLKIETNMEHCCPEQAFTFYLTAKLSIFSSKLTLMLDSFRLLNDYRKKCCAEQNLSEARRAHLKFEDLKNKEMLR
jgi:hypothetical protein